MSDSPCPNIIAAIDLGSNSIKMTVARMVGGELEEIAWRSEAVRIGTGVATTGRLADDRIAAARDTLARFVSFAKSLGTSQIIGVATEAVRVAENGESFLRGIDGDLGVRIETITGQREAELSFMGLHGIADLSGDVVIADIGGGSTEIIIARDEGMMWSRSFPLGSGDLTDRLVANDPPNAHEIDRCSRETREALHNVPWPPSTTRFYALGGTGEYLQRLATSPIDHAAVRSILERLTNVPSSDLARLLDVPVARARVLPAGIAIASAIVRLTNPPEILAAQSGIRRGLLAEAFAAIAPHD